MTLGCRPSKLVCHEGLGECTCDDGAHCRWKNQEPINDDCPCDYDAMTLLGRQNQEYMKEQMRNI